MKENEYYYGRQKPMFPYSAQSHSMGIPLLASVPNPMMQPIQIQLLPQLVQMMDQVKTGLEGAPSERQYLSNFEILVDALKVRKDITLPNSASDVLNKEEQDDLQAAGRVPMLALISAAFKQIDVFGLRIEYVEQDEPVQALYIPTLSAFRFEVSQSSQSVKSGSSGIHFVEFGNTLPPFDRNTLLNDLERLVSSKAKNSQICRGWFSVCFSKQSSAASSNTNSPLEVDFLVTYRVNAEATLGTAIKLEALYPSKDLQGQAQTLKFWFGN